MHNLQRNKQLVYYAIYEEKRPMRDSYGDFTGEYELTFTLPMPLFASVSAAKGSAEVEQFGISEDYTHVVLVDDMDCPINEGAIMWIGRDAFLPNNFRVVKVAKSLNHIAYAVKEVRT